MESERRLRLPVLRGECNLPGLRITKAQRRLDPGLPVQISPAGTRWVELQDGSLFLQWPDCSEFIITADGHTIIAYELGESQEDDLEALLLGPVISFALLKLGVEQIHGTAVVVEGEAVAFIGESACGKSTLAAAFVRAGCRLVTDDLLVLAPGDGRIWVQPGPHRIKLFPETAREVLEKSGEAAVRSSITPKLLIPLDPANFQATEVPLRGIYVLNFPDAKVRREITVRRLSQRNACIRLLKNNYNTVLMGPDRVAQPFTLAARIASAVPVKSLSYSRNFASLAQVREAIIADLTDK